MAIILSAKKYTRPGFRSRANPKLPSIDYDETVKRTRKRIVKANRLMKTNSSTAVKRFKRTAQAKLSRLSKFLP